MEWNEIFKILGTVLFGSVGLGSILFFSLNRYFGKKLEDLATKESLKEITTTIETIKQKLQVDTENIKAQLSVLTNRQNVMFVEEKNAIIEYLIAFNNWFNLVDNVINKTYEPDIYNSEKKLYEKFVDSNSKLELFLNYELIEASQYLNERALQYHRAVTEFIVSNTYYRNQRDSLMIKFEIAKGFGKDEIEIPCDAESFTKAEKDLQATINHFSTNHNNLYHLVVTAKEGFVENGRMYLKESLQLN